MQGPGGIGRDAGFQGSNRRRSSRAPAGQKGVGPARRGRRFALPLPGVAPITPAMLFALPFPNIDPVLVEIGPFAIRWYALAYVVGILLGWRYARGLAARGDSPLTPLLR